VLYFDEHQWDNAGVVNTVGGPPGDVDGITRSHLNAIAVQSDDPFSGDYEPVL
jgi:hypothetical protein